MTNLYEFIEKYLNENNGVVSSKEIIDKVRETEGEHGRILLGTFKARVLENKCSEIFKDLGCERKTIPYTKPNGCRTTRSVWIKKPS